MQARVQSQKIGWQDRTVFLHRRCPGVWNFSSVRRDGGNLAIHCQEGTKATADPHFLLHRRCPGVRNFSSVRRDGGNLAIHCQEGTKAMAFAHSMPRR